jgi:hypothetical protein
MMFAQIIQKYYPNLKPEQFISMFYDQPDKHFSIHQVCRVGMASYTGKPGSYWSCLTAMLCLRDRFVEYIGLEQGGKDQAKQVDDALSRFTFTNNVMNFNEIMNTKFATDEWDLLPESEDAALSQAKQVFTNRKLIFFIGLFGGDSISSENFDCLKEFFKLNTCMGMIAGVESKAYYLYGTLDGKFLYLDPHTTKVNLQ